LNFFFFSFFNQIYSSLLFKINPGIKQCFIDEFNQDSSVILKWKLITNSRKDVSELLKYITIKVTDENKKKVYETNIKLAKQKKTFLISEEGQYKICFEVQNYNIKEQLKEKVFANLKIISDNMEDIKLNNLISYQDLNYISNQTFDIRLLSEDIISKQKSLMQLEYSCSQDTINYTKWYKYITIIQLIIVFIIGGIQIKNYWNFLNKQNVL
jgi:hypothetical protein